MGIDTKVVAAFLRYVLALVLLQFSITGHCNWGDIFSGKGVATEVATLHEDDDIWGLDFSPDGKYLAANSPNTMTVHLWDWNGSGKVVRTFEKLNGRYDLDASESIRFSPDGKLLAGPATVWDVQSGAVVHDMKDPIGGHCVAVAFSLDSKQLFRAFDTNPELPRDNFTAYDTTDWRPLWSLRTVPFQPEHHVALSPDGKFAALAGKNYKVHPVRSQVVVVDLDKRSAILTLDRYALRVAWSPDSRRLVLVGGEPPVVIVDALSGSVVDTEEGQDGRALVRYTPDGKYLIECIERTVRIWDGQHKTLYQEIKARPGSIAVSNDGRYFALGGDKKVIIWQLK